MKGRLRARRSANRQESLTESKRRLGHSAVGRLLKFDFDASRTVAKHTRSRRFNDPGHRRAGVGQKPVYKCSGVYTDQPYKGGQEVDILPSRGAYSMSGQRKESNGAVMERVSGNRDDKIRDAFSKNAELQRCEGLRQMHLELDHSGETDLHGRRLSIRQE